MVSTQELEIQDGTSNKESVLHDLDGRIKLLVMVAIIVFAVASTNTWVFIILELYLLLLILISKIPLKTAFMKVLVIIPFGLSIAIFQPFIHPGTILYTLPFNIHVTVEGLEFTELLISRLIITVTSVVLFSFITPMQEIAESFRKLGVPNDFAMILSLFIRFIFLFYDQLEIIRNAQTSRGFSFTNNTPYSWKIKQMGYLFLMMFLRSYEQGENVFNSMLSRGYSKDSNLYLRNDSLSKKDYLYVMVSFLVIIILEMLVWFHVF
ncbi:MAG: cobalt ECF transporter T component CbiQ [Methanobacteriaceae archaeon]|nr:cobalt ECF transporter T component CbiQ [Methanobacteriaceae archaeon]